jgi:hypothetical protein
MVEKLNAPKILNQHIQRVDQAVVLSFIRLKSVILFHVDEPDSRSIRRFNSSLNANSLFPQAIKTTLSVAPVPVK